MVSPYKGWGDFFDVEYRVNGVWNTLLFDKFKNKLGNTTGKYIICAETYPGPEDTHGLMMDLTVNKLFKINNDMSMEYAYVLLEGKGREGKSFTKIEEQLSKFFAKAKADGGHFECRAIGTQGAKTAFYYYNTDHGVMNYQKIQQQAAGKFILVDADSRTEYNITQDNDWTLVDGVMTWIASLAP